MAEIPVEKKSSLSWLWWLLLAAGIIALIWWFISGNNDDEELVAANETEVTAPAYAEDTAMTTDGVEADRVNPISGLAGLATLDDMIGRQVQLTGVAVNQVVGDEAFTVGEGTNETLVMFDEYATPDTAMEGQVDVNPGSQVTIVGEVRAFPGDLPESVTREVDTTATAMIFATRVDTVE